MHTNTQIKRKPAPQTISPDGTIRGVITVSPAPTPPPQPCISSKQQLQVHQQPLSQPPSPRPHRPPPPYTPPLPIRSATTHNEPSYPARTPSPLPPPPPRSATTPTPTGPSTAQKAYNEATHFLGGLITHPTSSTKHTTILRHSSGIVFYRGSTTSVTISIFSDTPLPPTRTLYLQSKGWSGKTGMKTKAFLGFTDSWLNVTPTLPVHVQQVDPVDERAWQRDIGKFRKKATGRERQHVLRETMVVRIPVEAGDGYFQLVLCGDGENRRKVMCYSPVFRVLSTSLSPSSCRGASLSTMPLEVGAMVLGMYVQTAAEAVVAPVTAAVQSKVQPYQPSWVTQTAAETAVSVSGVGDRVGSVLGVGGDDDDEDGGGGSGNGLRDVQAGYQLALEEGPKPPFPVDLTARVEAVDSEGLRFRVGKVSDMVLDRYRGYFFGWARVEGVEATAERGPGLASGTWQGVVFSIVYFDPTQQERVNLSRTMKKVTTVRFIDEPVVPLRAQTKLQIRIMGFLRPDVPPSRGQTEKDLMAAREAAAEAAMLADACDVSYAQSILEHPAWATDRALVWGTRGMGTNGACGSGSGGWMDRTREGVENVKYRGQKWAEKVPLHWIGVRAPTDEARDKQIAVNGFYIVRG